MNKIFYTFLVVFILIGGFVVSVEAANPFDIQYPISELGSCVSQQECKVFCDKPTNIDVCIAFAENHGMIPKDQAQKMKKFEQVRNKKDVANDSPGSCKTSQECDAYCSVEEHMDECLNFGVKHGFTTQEEAKKIKEMVQKGGPGSCKTKEQCDNFCSNPKNEDECLSFVVKEGKITKQDAEFLKRRIQKHKDGRLNEPQGIGEKIDKEKVTKILIEKEGPGGCRTMEECGNYCSNFEHGEECLQFAVENKIASPKALEKIKKLSQIKSGPGGCKGPEECRQFCSNSDNRKECFEFTKRNKLASPEELKMMKREMEVVGKLEGGEGGPGGCQGEQECNSYCSTSEHMSECMQFAKKEGLLTGDREKEMMMQSRRILDKRENRVEDFPSKKPRLPFGFSKNDSKFPKDFMRRDDKDSHNGFGGIPPEMKNMSPEEFKQMQSNMQKMSPEEFKNIPENMRKMSPKEFEKLRKERMSAEEESSFRDGTPFKDGFASKKMKEDHIKDQEPRRDYNERQKFDNKNGENFKRRELSGKVSPEKMFKSEDGIPQERMRYRDDMRSEDFKNMRREDFKNMPQRMMPLNGMIPPNGEGMMPPPSPPDMSTEPVSFLNPMKFLGSVINAFGIKF